MPVKPSPPLTSPAPGSHQSAFHLRGFTCSGFIPLPADGHSGGVRRLALVNSAAVNIGVQVFVRIYLFSTPFGYLSGRGMAGSRGNFVLNLFEVLPN